MLFFAFYKKDFPLKNKTHLEKLANSQNTYQLFPSFCYQLDTLMYLREQQRLIFLRNRSVGDIFRFRCLFLVYGGRDINWRSLLKTPALITFILTILVVYNFYLEFCIRTHQYTRFM